MYHIKLNAILNGVFETTHRLPVWVTTRVARREVDRSRSKSKFDNIVTHIIKYWTNIHRTARSQTKRMLQFSLLLLFFISVLLTEVIPSSLSMPSPPVADTIISDLQSESLQLSMLQNNLKNNLYQHKISIGIIRLLLIVSYIHSLSCRFNTWKYKKF